MKNRPSPANLSVTTTFTTKEVARMVENMTPQQMSLWLNANQNAYRKVVLDADKFYNPPKEQDMVVTLTMPWRTAAFFAGLTVGYLAMLIIL